MENAELPIFKKVHQLYRVFYGYKNIIPKQDRYAIWQRCENIILDLLENILIASLLPRNEKAPVLEKTSLKLNALRIFFRLAKDVEAIDHKKYIILEAIIDEIGRMLGGWIRSLK